MPWHDDADDRRAHVDEAECAFAAKVRCACGGRFAIIGDQQPSFPDFTCDGCGQLVDVRISPRAEQTGRLAVPARAWQHYPEDVLLITRVKGQWIGEFKRFIRAEKARPFEPTINSHGTRQKNERFDLIPWRLFRPAQELGLVVMQLKCEGSDHE
jgi:hypothetical protein